MIVTGAKFSEIGAALFGPRKWHGVLAQMVDMDRSMIWRYSRGEVNVPLELRQKLAIMCRARGEALLRLSDQIMHQTVAAPGRHHEPTA